MDEFEVYKLNALGAEDSRKMQEDGTEGGNESVY